jgi:GalNAc5-diNAcBac-PP-undecaprenol beta-1,3-glucosyltransferase
MYRASVVIPTHEHAATLPFALESVQQQGIDDIEILIVGDGVNDQLRATIKELQAGDRRIRFFDLPKGPRHGEIHRDAVLRQAQGRIICYQCDDDLWLPGHLQAMEAALESADFVGAMQVDVEPGDRLRGYLFDLERPEFSKPWLEWKPHGFGDWANHGFGLAFAAHRLDAYFRLPEGWTTAPPSAFSTDQYMWHKFVRQPWCRARFLRWPVTLHFAAPARRDWSPSQRTDELARWSEIIASPEGWPHICRNVLTDLGDRLLNQSLADMHQRREFEAKCARDLAALENELAAVRTNLQAEQSIRWRGERAWSLMQFELAAVRIELETERSKRLRIEAQRDTLLASNS